jgi:hypothetical protein
MTLMEPANAEYRQFTDRLLEICREACRRVTMIHVASTPRLRDIPQLSLARPSGGSG